MTPGVRKAARILLWCLIFGLELAAAVALSITARTLIAMHFAGTPAGDLRIEGNPAARPQLAFACELDTEQLRALFSRIDVLADLTEMHAAVSLSLIDLSPGRAEVVRKLNQAGIPVTAWLALPKEQGYYISAGNAPEATARFTAFEQWTRDYGLRWAGIGLDIEPSLQDFGTALQGHWSRLALEILRRCVDIGSVSRARNRYAALIGRIEADGYPVETYQFPFIADGRNVHSTLLERIFGIVDVRGNREALMTYSSFNHAIDSALVWAYGQEAQILVVGSTAGDPGVDARFGPLGWNEFSRDAMVASHFSRVVGVYSLEGCVHQGFLPRLRTMDWGQTVTIPAEALRKVIRLRARIQAVLWTGSHLVYFALIIALGDLSLIWRRRHATRTSPVPPAALR